MCNFCNTCYNNGRSGCGCNTCGFGTGGAWNWGRQSICRDCNGDIWVNQRNGCGCNNACGCNSGTWNQARSTCGCGGAWNQTRNTCGCGCGSLWNQQWNTGCGCNRGGTDTTSNGNGLNGRFTCVTFCGRSNSTTQTTDNGVDLYYARQYGLYPFGYNRGCGCTLDAVNEL